MVGWKNFENIVILTFLSVLSFLSDVYELGKYCELLLILEPLVRNPHYQVPLLCRVKFVVTSTLFAKMHLRKITIGNEWTCVLRKYECVTEIHVLYIPIAFVTVQTIRACFEICEIVRYWSTSACLIINGIWNRHWTSYSLFNATDVICRTTDSFHPIFKLKTAFIVAEITNINAKFYLYQVILSLSCIELILISTIPDSWKLHRPH